MSLQSDFITALAAVASGDVYPQAVPEDAELPFVVYRILNKNPLTTIDSANHNTQWLVSFECYADTYAGALTLAGTVKTAIEASSLVYYEESAPGEDYEPLLDCYMEPVFYGFWHT